MRKFLLHNLTGFMASALPLTGVQVAESEAALVKRLIDRKTEVLVRGWTASGNSHVHASTGQGSVCVADCIRVTSAYGMLQDKMLTRVETARQEMQHIGDFDYGEPPSIMISKGCEAYARWLPA